MGKGPKARGGWETKRPPPPRRENKQGSCRQPGPEALSSPRGCGATAGLGCIAIAILYIATGLAGRVSRSRGEPGGGTRVSSPRLLPCCHGESN